jgi:hypothetical protein
VKKSVPAAAERVATGKARANTATQTDALVRKIESVLVVCEVSKVQVVPVNDSKRAKSVAGRAVMNREILSHNDRTELEAHVIVRAKTQYV